MQTQKRNRLKRKKGIENMTWVMDELNVPPLVPRGKNNGIQNDSIENTSQVYAVICM